MNERIKNGNFEVFIKWVGENSEGLRWEKNALVSTKGSGHKDALIKALKQLNAQASTRDFWTRDDIVESVNQYDIQHPMTARVVKVQTGASMFYNSDLVRI